MKMKKFRIFVVMMMAICMLMTGCGKHTNPSTSANPSNPTVIVDTNTQEPTSQDANGTTETTSQGNTNSGDYVSSDSRITPVRLEDYWISDTEFDFINYCRDQGATVKYMFQNEDGSMYYCLPEELSSADKEPLAITMFFYFGGDSEYLSMMCPFNDGSDQFWAKGSIAMLEPCIGTSFSGTNVRITIDDFGHTLSLSTINHLPIIYEYMMVLPYDSSVQTIHDTFSAHYQDIES
jgi:hypothetical protein